MAQVRRIASISEIPSDRKHVLVTLGSENKLTRDAHNLIFTVDRTISGNLLEAHLATTIGDAELLADQEHIDDVYVCV
jgi:hypothetical protein